MRRNRYVFNIYWEKDFTPTYWPYIDANVIRSGYNEYGIRIHIVDKEQIPDIIRGALVMSENYLNE
jgi:hypothetical protein